MDEVSYPDNIGLVYRQAGPWLSWHVPPRRASPQPLFCLQLPLGRVLMVLKHFRLVRAHVRAVSKLNIPPSWCCSSDDIVLDSSKCAEACLGSQNRTAWPGPPPAPPAGELQRLLICQAAGFPPHSQFRDDTIYLLNPNTPEGESTLTQWNMQENRTIQGTREVFSCQSWNRLKF